MYIPIYSIERYYLINGRPNQRKRIGITGRNKIRAENGNDEQNIHNIAAGATRYDENFVHVLSNFVYSESGVQVI